MLKTGGLIATTLMLTTILSLTFTPASCASQHGEARRSILEEKGEIRLMLIDATTSQPIANTHVEVSEVVFCKRAPCPPIVLWGQKSDSDGSVRPPHKVITKYAVVGAEKYASREIEFAIWNVQKKLWTINLVRPNLDNHLGEKK